jgi:outer membrane protein insertion porin family
MRRGKLNFGLLLLLCLTIIFSTSILQAQAPQQFKINNIRIEGNTTADSSLILLNSGLIRETYISADQIQRAVKNLWALNIFSDIQIIAERQIGESIDLLVKVEEFPRLESWTIEGNKKLKKKDVDKEMGFYKGMVFTPFVQYKAKRALINKYKDEGYLLANVRIDTVSTPENQVQANMIIKEGKKVQVKKIRVLGSEILSENELKKAFKKIKEDRWWREIRVGFGKPAELVPQERFQGCGDRKRFYLLQ